MNPIIKYIAALVASLVLFLFYIFIGDPLLGDSRMGNLILAIVNLTFTVLFLYGLLNLIILGFKYIVFLISSR